MSVKFQFKEQTKSDSDRVLSIRNSSNYKVLYSLFFLGVLIHEISHWIMCKLTGVRVYDFSLTNPLAISSTEDNQTLGFVSYSSTTSLTKSILINTAPLFISPLIGFSIVLYIANSSLPLVATIVTLPIFTFATPSEPDLQNIQNTVAEPRGIMYFVLFKLIHLLSVRGIVYKLLSTLAVYLIVLSVVL